MTSNDGSRLKRALHGMRYAALALPIVGLAWFHLTLQAAAQDNRDPRSRSAKHACIIEPEEIVKLASPVVGVIAQVNVDRGDTVRKGQIVARLEDGVERATLALARAKAADDSAIRSADARLQFLRKKYGRIGTLHAKSVGSLADLQEAEAQVRVAEQQLKEAKLNRRVASLEVKRAKEVVEQRTVRSPIDGVVVERLLGPGEYRDERSPILTLAKIDRLKVEAIVSAAWYGKIKVGSRAEVRPEAPIGGVHTAVVSVVDRVLDAASGTFGVRLALPNPDLSLPSGIRCSVTFETSAAGTPPAPAHGAAAPTE